MKKNRYVYTYTCGVHVYMCALHVWQVAQCKEATCQCRRCRFNPWVGTETAEGNGNLP